MNRLYVFGLNVASRKNKVNKKRVKHTINIFYVNENKKCFLTEFYRRISSSE